MIFNVTELFASFLCVSTLNTCSWGVMFVCACEQVQHCKTWLLFMNLDC